MAQPRITSTLTFDEKLFEEYFAGKDRPLNRRDALIFSIGDGLLFGIWFWAGILFNFNFNLMGWIFGIVVGLALVLGIAEALTGATIFWPRRLWRKTYTRFFCAPWCRQRCAPSLDLHATQPCRSQPG